MTSITFLGTGGGRFATIYQIRATGGIYLNDGVRIHLDPGPSALMNMRRASIDPARTDAIVISHCHPDHYADAEMLIEGMTHGGFKRSGTLIGSLSVLEGAPGFSPAISKYHRSIPGRVIIAEPKGTIDVKGMRIDVTRTMHSDPTGVGFRFHTSNGVVSYFGDSELSPELIEEHRGARVLILNITRPLMSRVPKHMCTEDAAMIADVIRPEVLILTHFGMKLVHDGVDKQTTYIEEKTGVRTIPAEDLMTVHIGNKIRAVRFEHPIPETGKDYEERMTLDH